MEDSIANIDEYSGKPIRLTDNDLKEDDIVSSQDPDILELDPVTRLPVWWEKIKEKRGDIVEHA